MVSDKEKQEVELILDRIMELKGNDKIYFQLYIKNKLKKNLGLDITKFDSHYPDNISATKSFWPPNDPNWYKMNFSSSSSSSSGSGASGVVSTDKKGAEASDNAPVKEVKFK